MSIVLKFNILTINTGQGRPLAGRQQYRYPYEQVGTIPWFANIMGNQCFRIFLCGD